MPAALTTSDQAQCFGCQNALSEKVARYFHLAQDLQGRARSQVTGAASLWIVAQGPPWPISLEGEFQQGLSLLEQFSRTLTWNASIRRLRRCARPKPAWRDHQEQSQDSIQAG